MQIFCHKAISFNWRLADVKVRSYSNLDDDESLGASGKSVFCRTNLPNSLSSIDSGHFCKPEWLCRLVKFLILYFTPINMKDVML